MKKGGNKRIKERRNEEMKTIQIKGMKKRPNKEKEEKKKLRNEERRK